MELQDRLILLESAASQHQQILDATVQESQTQVQKLQEEKALIEVRGDSTTQQWDKISQDDQAAIFESV